jgi:hypothetical protein
MRYKEAAGVKTETLQEILERKREPSVQSGNLPEQPHHQHVEQEIDFDKDPFKDHELDPYNHVNKLMRLSTEEGMIQAANFLREYMGHSNVDIELVAVAKKYLNTVFHSLLDADMYREAGTMNWGYDVVDFRPKTVEELSEFFQTQNLMALMGASSMGKSYVGVAWLYLDYQRDPDFTSIKLVTISASKLESLLFSPLNDLHAASVMTVIGKKESGFRFTHKPENVNVGFQGLLVPQDQKGTGKIKGIKYYRRAGKRHPIFGNKTRTRIFIDEFQDCSSSIINELASPASQISDPYSMKIVLSGNPTDYALAEAFGILTEPPEGWLSLDLDFDVRWKSKRGYAVYRLDGKRCENVIYRNNVCPGMMSFQAFDNFSRDPESSEFWTFARGMFPIQGGVNTLFSTALLESSTAQAIFHEGSVTCAFVDVGLKNDKAIIAFGRVGKATGRISPLGERVLFTSGTEDAERMSRIILYLEEMVELSDHYGDAIKLAQSIRRECNNRNVLPNHLGVDSTGMGEGVASYLSNYFGRVLIVHNAESPSEVRILKEDKQLPKELYSRTIDEIWYASHKWFQVGAFLINPQVEHNKLYEELTTRKLGRNVSNNGRRRIESKQEWKSRNGNRSPDYADACNGLCHVVRMRTGMVPAMDKENETTPVNENFRPPNADYVESLHYNELKDGGHGRRFNMNKLRKSNIVGSHN